MADLVLQFQQAMLDIYKRAKTEIRYNPTAFLQMVTQDGGVVAANRLINGRAASDGYTTLYEKGRLDLSVEALVVDNPKWHPLFSPEVIARARKRLQDYRYKFPPPTAEAAPEPPTDAQEASSPWTQDEVDACVEAYLDMLDHEIAGRPYTKVDFSKEVQAATGRSKGSVEFKFGNISAILNQLGLRWIQGYKPAPNAQAGAIRDALGRLLGAQAALAKRLEIPVPAEPRAPLPDHITSVFTDPPSKSEGSSSKAALPPGSNVKKFDRALTDAKNRDLGRAGEEFVLTVERARLREEGRADLADNVTWISEEQGDGAGYDIASFNEDGGPRLIEVKTTNGAATTSFLVTANEVEVSRANPDHYWLYRVYDLAKEPRIYCEKGPLDDGWTLEPAVYRAKR